MFELGRGLLEVTIQIVGEEVEVTVVVDEAAVDAAVVEVPNTIESGWIGHWERLQQNRVNQSEYGSVGTDAKSQRDDGDGCQGWATPELACTVSVVFILSRSE